MLFRSEDGIEIFEQRLGAPDNEGEQREKRELARHRGDPETGQPGRIPLNNDVDRETDQHRWSEIKEFVENRTDRRQNHQATVGLQQLEKLRQPR